MIFLLFVWLWLGTFEESVCMFMLGIYACVTFYLYLYSPLNNHKTVRVLCDLYKEWLIACSATTVIYAHCIGENPLHTKQIWGQQTSKGHQERIPGTGLLISEKTHWRILEAWLQCAGTNIYLM